jgi:hypothetical protein
MRSVMMSMKSVISYLPEPLLAQVVLARSMSQAGTYAWVSQLCSNLTTSM